MKILITGSSGFIGKNIVSYLSKKNEIIAACWKLNKKKKRNIKFIRYTKKNLDKLSGIDAIVHCAASTPPKYSQEDCYKNNKIIDNLAISFAESKKIKIFIYLSSMSVYGKNKNLIVKEKNSPKNIDLYGLSKFESEKKLLKISKKKIQSILILRLSSILGKGSHSTFLSNLKNSFLKKNFIKINNKDSLFNGCLHINDLNFFIEKILGTYKKSYDFINIASYKPIKLEKIINLFKKKYKKRLVTYSTLKTPTYIVDIKKAIYKYKFKKISSESTLKKYLELN